MAKTVKPQGRGAPAPKASIPAKRAAKKKAKAKPAASSGSHYIRNLHNGAGGARVDLTDGTRLFLEPRGQVGDLILVNDEIRNDPHYQRNLDILYQELSQEEGLEVLRKQGTNAQAPRPSLMDHITNPKGEKYAQVQATVTDTYESQGQVVGEVSLAKEGQHSSQIGNIERPMGPQEVERPGSRSVFDPNVMPAGLTVDQAKEFIETPPEDRQDLIIRWVTTDGLNVTVEPTQGE